VHKHLLNSSLLALILAKASFHSKHQLCSLECVLRTKMANLHLTFLIVFTSLQQLMLLNVDVKSVPNVLSSLSHLTHFSCNQVLPDNFASNNFKHWTKIRILNVTDVSPKHLLSVQQLEQLSIDLRMRDVHKTVERFVAVLSSLTRLLHSLSCDIRTHFAQFLPATS
jgi:hypothetical protein